MKEKTYSCPCPVHGQILTTKKTKSVRSKETGNIYTKPIYYCPQCRAYYIFIDEYKSSFRKTILVDGGSPIYIRGKYSADSIPQDKQIKTTIEQDKLKISNLQKNGNIIRRIEDGALSVNVIPEGHKVPKKCKKCGTDTCKLIYLVKDMSGKEKKLGGKECPACGEIYYTESIYIQHKTCFININEKKEDTTNIDMATVTLNQEIRELIRQYLKTTDKELKNNICKELIATKENIDALLKSYLSPDDRERNKRIFYVGMRRSPELFLRELWEEYKENKKEFSNQIKMFDFQHGVYYKAAISLFGEISPYPEALLGKLNGNRNIQYFIRDELAKGKFNLAYIKFLSKNRDMVLEPWIQKQILIYANKKEQMENYIAYIDLNSEAGLRFLNSKEDFAIINHIYIKNMWGLNEQNFGRLTDKVKIIYKLIKFKKIDESLKIYFDNDIRNSQRIISTIQTFPIYKKFLFELVDLIDDLSIMERLYLLLFKKGIDVAEFDDILLKHKSDILLDVWLERIKTSNTLYKNISANRILKRYPQEISKLVTVVEQTQNDIFIKNIKKKAEDLQFEWVIDKPVTSNISRRYIKAEDNITQEKPKRTRENTIDKDEKFMDDFGNEFDFSELKHLLDFI